MSDLFDLESHTVLRASAGTGKTEALTNQYLRLITGATSLARPIPPRRIVAVTFTEKAAAEMRHRIHRALSELRSDVPDAQALHSVRQLRSVLRERNISLTPPVLSELLRGLATARIMTIHALCLSLLQDHAAQAGVDPMFAVLDDERSTVLLEQAIEEMVLRYLEIGHPDLPNLINEVSGFHPMPAQGIVPLLKQLYLACKESGNALETIFEGSVFSDSKYQAIYTQTLRRLGVDSTQPIASVWQRFIQLHQALCEPTPGVRQHKPSIQRLRQCIAQLEAKYPSGAQTLDELAAAECALQAACGTGKLAEQEPAANLRAAVRELWALPRARKHAACLGELLVAVEARYTELKRADGFLDYQDLTLGARDLLTKHPDIQRQVAEGIDVLLVDEFQDTNAAQRDIVQSLVRPVAVSPTSSRLFIVGDRKQSIYGFRGADVLVFEQFVESLQQEGAQTTALQTSYRSSPSLLQGLNILSGAALQPSSDEPADLKFSTIDALYPPADANSSSVTAAVELLCDPSQPLDPDAEAHRIASRAVELVSCKQGLIRESGQLRQARFADMALLLPRFTHVQVYLAALQELSVPFAVVRNKGLMAGAEARDILSICKVLLHRDETLDLLAVLRSPCCTCSDPTLVSMANALRGATDPLARLANIEVPFLDADEQQRFERCQDILIRLRDSVEALGLGRSLKLLLTHCQYTAVLAGLPSAHQRLSNVDRILEEIASREYRGDSPAQILRDLLRRQRLGTGDYETAVALESADVLSVMTIHQAKGLEFPVVFAADLGRKLLPISGLAVYDGDPDGGLSVAVRGLDGKRRGDPTSERIRARLKARQIAESKRLFYVQITRARDRLILSGTNQGLLKTLFQSALPELARQGLLYEPASDNASATHGPVRSVPHPSAPVSTAWPTPAVSRNTIAPTLEASVTALQDFALCPRRYRAAQVLRLPQYPRMQPADPAAAPLIDPRERGTWLHSILEQLEFSSAVRDPIEAAENAFMSLPPTLKSDLYPRLVGFLQSDYVRAVADLETLQREVPFALHIHAPSTQLTVHGQIDLMWTDGSSLDVIDYKVTTPKADNPVADYAFQLEIYALAANRALPKALNVKRGIQFLDGKVRLPTFIETPFDASLIEDQLRDVADALWLAQKTGSYPGKPKAYCDSIGCGFRWLCHPRATKPDSANPHPSL